MVLSTFDMNLESFRGLKQKSCSQNKQKNIVLYSGWQEIVQAFLALAQ